ncbi:hypothetical protein OKHIL_65700 [Mycolicibacterium mageritense]|nr:hypothetical protein MTY414_08960 [Mycolicibacterium mageritense]
MLPSANPFPEVAERGSPFLKSAKCGFESDWGHSKGAGQRTVGRSSASQNAARTSFAPRPPLARMSPVRVNVYGVDECGDAELAELVALLRERNALDARLGRLLERPVNTGSIGEWIAARIFDIELAKQRM